MRRALLPAVTLHISGAAVTLSTEHALQIARSVRTLVHSAPVVFTAKDLLEALLKRCLTFLQLLGESRACMHVPISQSATLQKKARSALKFSLVCPVAAQICVGLTQDIALT